MKASRMTKATVWLLCICMLVSAIPLAAFAIEYTENDGHYLKLVSKREWELAPGITEAEIVLSRADGSQRQVNHVVEVDIHNPYTKVIPSTYKMADGLENKEYSVQIMSEQARYAEEHGYGNVVAAMNTALHWYDTDYYKEHPELIGEPLGTLILDGEYYRNSQNSYFGAYTCLVVNFDEKDGQPRPAHIPKTQVRQTYDAITGWEEQLIPVSFHFLVKNGVNEHVINDPNEPAPRSFLGIKADGTIVMVMNEGRQAPYSTGFNCYEMAEFMISLGCVQAVNCDGGGSSTFLSQRPGEELELHCSPSDGGERATTHGILVISTAPAAGELETARISSDYDYYTPGSTVQFHAAGLDRDGAAADIPATAVWELADPTFGTLEDGMFVSNGKTGAVTVRLTLGGEILGEDTVYMVAPDALAFASSHMVVPYGGRVNLGLSATYEGNEVALQASDVIFVLSDTNIGTVNGLYFTAGKEGLASKQSTLTAAVKGITATTQISLGAGSAIVYSFEEADAWNPDALLDDWSIGALDGNAFGELHVVNRSGGQGKNGDYVLAASCDFTQVERAGEHTLRVRFPEIDCSGAAAVGFWLYVPAEARYVDMEVAGKRVSLGEYAALREGWHYVSAPVTGDSLSHIDVFVDDGEDAPNLNGRYTFYIDDITLDYSDATADRVAPVLSGLTVVHPQSGVKAAVDGQVIDFGRPSFEVTVRESAAVINASGVDAASAKAYVDGVEVNCSYKDGKIVMPAVSLADGCHIVAFVISDKQGNQARVEGQIYVQSGSSAPAVQLVPRDPEADRLLIGSVYWLDLTVSDVESIDEVELVLNLNNASAWELAGMTVAEGFTATYAVRADENVASIILTRDGENRTVGRTVLASIPVRTWVSSSERSSAALVKDGAIWAQSLELTLEKGAVTYADAYLSDVMGVFGMADLRVDTELFFNYASKDRVDGAQTWMDSCVSAGVGFHTHTALPVEDESASCTKPGYVGRTYCDVCDSVVQWGSVNEAAGHDYMIVGGRLVCSCGFTITDTGLYLVGGKAYYTIGGQLQSGWISVGDDWYYFDKSTYAGLDGEKVADKGVAFVFEQGRLTDGVWVKTAAGTRYWYGPGYYRDTSPHSDSSRPYEIDGKTYLFNKSGYMLIGIGLSFVGGVTKYYVADENGVAKLYTGPYGNYFYADGVQVNAYRLVKADGYFYFIGDGHKIARNTRVYLSSQFVAGHTYEDGTPLKVGYYEFDAEGRMIVKQDAPTPEAPDPAAKNGVYGNYLYINDVRQTCYKLVKYDGFLFYRRPYLQ